MAENLCRKAGCADLCCRSDEIEMFASRNEIKALIPNAREVTEREILYINEIGEYYCKSESAPEGLVLLRILGGCPLYNRGCTVYERRFSACRNLAIGSSDCESFRRQYVCRPFKK